jgi:hypothetical protein
MQPFKSPASQPNVDPLLSKPSTYAKRARQGPRRRLKPVVRPLTPHQSFFHNVRHVAARVATFVHRLFARMACAAGVNALLHRARCLRTAIFLWYSHSLRHR